MPRSKCEECRLGICSRHGQISTSKPVQLELDKPLESVRLKRGPKPGPSPVRAKSLTNNARKEEYLEGERDRVQKKKRKRASQPSHINSARMDDLLSASPREVDPVSDAEWAYLHMRDPRAHEKATTAGQLSMLQLAKEDPHKFINLYLSRLQKSKEETVDATYVDADDHKQESELREMLRVAMKDAMSKGLLLADGKWREPKRKRPPTLRDLDL